MELKIACGIGAVCLVALVIGLSVGLTRPSKASDASEDPAGFPQSEHRKFRFASVSSDATLCGQIGT